MSVLETDQLAELIDRKHTCLTELRKIGRRQLELVRGGEMTALLDVLAVKQRLIERLQSVERELAPFRSQSPQGRKWPTELHRQRCAKQIDMCEAILGEIMQQEKLGESELVQRRDEAAARLDGAHRAGKVRGAYMAAQRQHTGRLDLASEH